MTKLSELRRKLLTGVFALAVVLGVFAAGVSATSFVSCAETRVTVKPASGAKVRESATTTSTMIGSAEKGKVLTVLSQVQGSDGYTWYQVQFSADKTGYIRGDLVDVSGDEPAAGGEEPPAEVTEVNPVNASVSGDSGKIRSNASSASQILKEIPSGSALTVTGQATDADGKVWYKVSFISEDNTQVDGFIRSDYVSLSEELTPKTEEPAPTEPTSPEPVEEKKPYDVIMQDGDWLLVDYYTYDEPKGWSVREIFDNLNTYDKLLQDREKDVKNQKVIIIILVFLLVAAVAGIAFLVFKIRDMMDSAYYSEVENETLRRKNASGSRGGQKVMHTVGTDKSSGRPASAKPAGQGTRPGSSSQGTKSAGGAQGARPAGASQGTRPAGGSQGARSAGGAQGARPAAASQGARPAGASQGARPAGSSQGARPAGASQGPRSAGSPNGARPAGASQGQRPAGASQGARPAGASQSSRSAGSSNGARPAQQVHSSSQRVQPKNFMEEDDDFEFEFLNYDGEEE